MAKATKPAKRKSNISAVEKVPKDTVAQRITGIFGSLTFLIVFISFLAIWMSYNLGLFGSKKTLDPYPFDKLELFLSSFAICLSIAVLISQKRQAKLEKIAEEVEFEVNLRAEKEITKVLQMLQRIHNKLGIDHSDPELDDMLKDLDTKKIHQKQKEIEKDD